VLLFEKMQCKEEGEASLHNNLYRKIKQLEKAWQRKQEAKEYLISNIPISQYLYQPYFRLVPGSVEDAFSGCTQNLLHG
jgi:hypothetical protein